LKNQGYKSILKNASYLITAQMIVRLLKTLYLIVLIRHLGPEVYGLFQYAQNWYVTFTPITLLGIGAILSREIGKDKKTGPKLIGRALALRSIVAFFLMIITLTIGYVVEPNPDTRSLLVIFSFLLLGRALLNWTKEVYIAYENTKYHFIQVVLSNLFQIGWGFYVMFNNGGAIELAIVYVASLYIEFFVTLVFINVKIAPVKIDFRFSKLFNLLRKGIAIGIAFALIRWMLMGPVIIYRYVLDSEHALGQLALVMLLLFFVSLVIEVMLHSSLPVLSRFHSRKEKDSLHFIEVMLQTSIPVCTLFAIVGMTFGEYFITVIFGSEYSVAGRIFGPSLWMILPYMMIIILSQLFIIKEKVTVLAQYVFGGTFFMTSLLPIFALRYQIEGGVVAPAMGLYISAIGIFMVAIKEKYINFEDMQKPLLASVTSFAIYITISSYINSYIGLIVSSIFIIPYLFLFLRRVRKVLTSSEE